MMDNWRLTIDNQAVEAYHYDLLGRLTNKLDPAGNTTTFAYDANGNLASLQRGASAPFTFGYDALNRRTNMVDSVGTTAWRYDALGRLVGESGPFGTPEVQVAYDPNGRLTNVTWGAFSVDYSFDDLGRIVAVAAPEGTYAFTYLSNGIRRATVAYPNGVTEVRAHDELARCTSLAFLSGTNPLLSIAYAYDAGDRRTNEVWSTGRAMAYGYDNAHQLTSVDAARPSDAARYRYDAAGNPVDRAELGLDVTNSFNNLNQIVTGSWTGATVTVAGSVNYPAGSISVNGQPGTVYPDSSFDVAAVPVVPGTNTLTATYTGPAYTNAPMTAIDTTTVVLGDTLYTHDANGNLTGDATFTYQYDTANQLTNVIRKSDNTRVLSCRYDALGRRVEAIRSDGTVDRYVYFPGSFLVLAVLDETNAPKEFYTRGPDLSGTLDSAGGIGGILACTYSTGPVLFHHADLMGNVIALSDSSASLLSIFRHTPFGQPTLLIGGIWPRYLFSSKEYDAGTTQIYYGYRYYAPHLGRWLTRDPIAENGGCNLYIAMCNATMINIDCFGERVVIRKGPDSNHRIATGGKVIKTTSAFVDVILDVFQKAATYTGDSTGRPLQCLKIVLEKPWFSWFSKSIGEIRYQPGADYDHPCCQNSSVISYLMEMMDSPNDVFIYQTTSRGGASQFPSKANGHKISDIYLNVNADIRLPVLQDDGRRGPEEKTPFDVTVMHELLGHAAFWFSGDPWEHPRKPWNEYDSDDPRGDPIIERENEYRIWKGYPRRYPKYWRH